MNLDFYLKNAHLYLGLTKHEIEKRISLGLIDPEILKKQLDQYSLETQYDVVCEKYLESQSLEQMDRFVAEQ